MPLYYFLYIFFGFLVVWTLFSLITFFHLFHFGLKELKNYFVGFIFVAGCLIIGASLFNEISVIDWQAELSINIGAPMLENN